MKFSRLYKDLRFVDKIIKTFVDTAIHPSFDVTDIVMPAENNNSTAYKKRFAAEFKALPSKYPTTKAQIKLMVASAALWSLGSNARQHPLVDQRIQKYIADTPYDKITLPLKIVTRKR